MTTHTSGAADLPEALHRVIDEFERRERGIPQAHIAAALVTELRAALAAGQTAVSAIDASPSAASIAWNALRDATDPLGELGARIMGHVRIFAQRQYEAGRDEVRPAPPAMDSGEDAERWEFRRLNPANKLHVAPSDLGWKTVNSKGMLSEKEVLEYLQAYRYQGKPVYEVRPLFATKALEKPEIRCPVRLANGGDCPRHNLQCGWPGCNKESK